MRAGRLVSFLLLLQTRGLMTADQLARELEVSARTIYRDVEALSEAGVPIYADRGPLGGIRLVDGYRTRLTGLTTQEAEALFLSGLPGPAAELGLGTVVAAARLKVLAALPPELRTRASRISQRFHLDAPGWFQTAEQLEHLEGLAEAVWENRTVEIDYPHDDGPITRRLDPLGLVLKAGIWYLVARIGGGLRTYRVSRILGLRTTGVTFERPEDFDLAAHWAESTANYIKGRPRIGVTFRFQGGALDEVLDSIDDRFRQEIVREPDPDRPDCELVRVKFDWFDEAELAALRLGGVAEVLEPAELRRRMVERARDLLARYGEPAGDDGGTRRRRRRRKPASWWLRAPDLPRVAVAEDSFGLDHRPEVAFGPTGAVEGRVAGNEDAVAQQRHVLLLALRRPEDVVVARRFVGGQRDEVLHREPPDHGIAHRADPDERALLEHPSEVVEIGGAGAVVGAVGARTRLVVVHRQLADRAVVAAQPHAALHDVAVRNVGHPLREVVARGVRVGHADEEHLRVEREHDPERRSQVERRQCRIHARDDVRPDGRSPRSCAGTRPCAARAGRVRAASVMAPISLGSRAGIDELWLVLDLVQERERRDDERAARAEHLEERIHDCLGAAIDPAERPQCGMDEHRLRRTDAERLETSAKVVARDFRRNHGRLRPPLVAPSASRRREDRRRRPAFAPHSGPRNRPSGRRGRRLAGWRTVRRDNGRPPNSVDRQPDPGWQDVPPCDQRSRG